MSKPIYNAESNRWRIIIPCGDVWYYPGDMTSDEVVKQAWEDYKAQKD